MSERPRKTRVLFVCTGNACRSQMAEGWARQLRSDTIEAYSAGVSPAGVSTRATAVMAEAGVDISAHRSQHVSEFADMSFDYVVTLCGHAEQKCPVFGGAAKHVHRAFDDPVMVIGSIEQIMAAFRRARDEIRAFVETLPESLEVEADGSGTEG
ncbi:MAG: arsenate reductase ArsC [Planctomycetota bacterium]